MPPKKPPSFPILPMPDERPPIAPPISAAFILSSKLLPCANDPRPAPNAPEAIVPMPGKTAFNTKGKTTGAIFLTTFTTPLTAFLIPPTSFLRKNSRCPVIGLTELLSDPTTYASGSAPSAAIARLIMASISGFFSATSRGTITSRSEA